MLILVLFSIYGCHDNTVTETDTKQLSEDPLFYANNIYNYWSTGKYDTAIIYAKKILELEPPLFVSYLHTSISIGIMENNLEASEFLIALYNSGNEDINNIIRPVYIWSKIKSTQSNDSIILMLDELNILRRKDFLSAGKPELYLLKSLMEIDNKGLQVDVDGEDYCSPLIQDLKDSLNKIGVVDNSAIHWRRAYIRVLLSNSFYYLSNYGRDGYLFEMAADYSPDKTDKKSMHGYFYTSYFLKGHYNNFGYKEEYLDYLLENNKLEEGLSVLSIIAIDKPITSNLERLKTLFKKVHPNENFKQYWYDLFTKNSDTFPELTFHTLDGLSIDSRQLRGKWTFIDIWGTWCVPCVEELPDIEKFYQASFVKYNKQLDVLSLSYQSEDVKSFLERNNYTFFVAEIDNYVTESLRVVGFPTKILVSPEGRYRTINYNADWIEYIDNYCLIVNNNKTIN